MRAAAMMALALCCGRIFAAGTSDRMYARGLEAEGQKAYGKAVVYFEAATLADPGNAQVLRHLGNCRYYLGEKAKAVIAYDAYLSLQPADAQLRAFNQSLKPTPTPEPTPVPTVVPIDPTKASYSLAPVEGPGSVVLGGWETGVWRKYNLYVLNKQDRSRQKLNPEPLASDQVEVRGMALHQNYLFNVVYVTANGLDSSDTIPFEKKADEPLGVSPGPVPFVVAAEPGQPAPVFAALPAASAAEPKASFRLEPAEGTGFAALSGWQAGASRTFNLYLQRPDGHDPSRLNATPFGQEVVEVTGLVPGRKYSFYTAAILSGVETKDRLPLTKIASEAPSAAHWLSPREGADLAEGTRVPTLYDFTAAWCGPCRMLEKDVFEDPDSAAWLNRNFILVRVMDRRREEGSNDVRVQNLQLKYQIQGFPTVLAKDGSGKEVGRFVGYGGKEAAAEALNGFAVKAAGKKGN